MIAGSRCERLLEDKVQSVPVKDVQCDEIWGWVGCKEKNNEDNDPAKGDASKYIDASWQQKAAGK